tara:strand:- start:3116 stop:4237 length:1122 start_codon:yes stop_codon:yes gene_type:complete
MDDSEPVTVYPLHLVACSNCELLQLNYTVPKEVMFKTHGYLSGMTKTLRDHFFDIAKENVHTFGVKDRDLVVDIGGNDGTQLLQYQKLGIENTVNIESAVNIAQISTDNGIKTINGFCNEQLIRGSFEKESAKIINAAGVFFHLEELHSVIEGIRYLMAKDGVFTVQCMYAAELVKNESFDMIYHEHLCYYTLNSLTNLLKPYGLNVFDAYHSPIHSGSLIVKICKDDFYKKTMRYERTKEEDSKYDLASFRRFADKMRHKQGDLRKLLEDLKSKGNKIYAYGAPAKGNTLLNYEGIDLSLVDKAVEINELKIGNKLPMSDIPIEKETVRDYPDYYLLLSHNFEEEILKKNQLLLDEGVKFIIPFPKVKVVGK